jgi:protein translocase SecG subunit
MEYFLMILFLIVCLLLISVVLLQKGRGGGLGAAFGGGSSSAFGTRTGDVFTWVTIVLTALFLLLAVVGTLVVRPPAGQVDEPIVSPDRWTGSEMDDRVKVSMRVTTKGASIHYTIDGGEPTPRSSTYHKTPITVRKGQTLRAKAFRAGMDPSETVVVTYVPKPDQPLTAPADAAAAVRREMPTDLREATTQPTTAPAATTQPAAE